MPEEQTTQSSPPTTMRTAASPASGDPGTAGEFYRVLAEHYDALFPVDGDTVERLFASAEAAWSHRSAATNRATPGGPKTTPPAAASGTITGRAQEASAGGTAWHTARALDLGCGTGGYVRALSARGVLVWGTDVSPEMIDRARGADPGRDDAYAVADMRDAASHPATPFDLVYCIGNTVAHLPSLGEVRRWVQSVRPALRPHGVLCVQFVDISGLDSGSTKVLPNLEAAPAADGHGVTMSRRYIRVDAEHVRFDALVRVGNEPPLRVSQPLLALETSTLIALLEEERFRVTETFGTWAPLLVAEATHHDE